MSGVYKSHPNNVIYLTEKFRLDTKDIGKILSMIDPLTRQRYDYDNIEALYTEYVADKVDDHEVINLLKRTIADKEVLLLVPGNSLNTHRDIIDCYNKENNPIVISVNFVVDDTSSYAFFGNMKRYARLKTKRAGIQTIISSNITSDNESDYVVNYQSLINRGYKYFENSTIMLLSLLKRISPRKITIAGFDGFQVNLDENYFDSSFQNERHIDEFETLNFEVTEMFKDIVKTMSPACTFEFITPSLYEQVIAKA